jgi:pyridoxamine 5'-phosphate oxidase-like protein
MDGGLMATKDHPGQNAAADDPELAAVARQVIDANRYLVLGTADQHGVPWLSPVWYAHARIPFHVLPESGQGLTSA